MEPTTFFAIAAIIIFLGFAGELVFKKTNIPDVLWLMIFGVVISHVLGYTQTEAMESFAAIFTTFALIFILFEGALHLRVREIFKGVYGGSLLSVVNFVASALVIIAITQILGYRPVQSVLLGTILGGTSSAVAIPIVKRLNISKQAVSSLVLESALSDVLCIVGTLTVAGVYVAGVLDIAGVINILMDKFVVALFIGGAGGYLWLHVLRRISHHAKSYMITVAFLLMIYSFATYIHSEGAMAALAFGLVLGNSDRIMKLKPGGDPNSGQSTIKSSEIFFYAEISFLVKSFFFVYLGMILNFMSPAPYIIGGAIVAGLYLVRPVSTLIAGRMLMPEDRAVTDSMIPKGLAAAVLVSQPEVMMLMPDGTRSVVLAVILISIILCTIFVFLAERKKFLGLSNFYRKKILRKEDAPCSPLPKPNSGEKTPPAANEVPKPQEKETGPESKFRPSLIRRPEKGEAPEKEAKTK
ncbi:MAG: cation:proton antiporter [Candidatus Aenigmatarchaeota archaeon]